LVIVLKGVRGYGSSTEYRTLPTGGRQPTTSSVQDKTKTTQRDSTPESESDKMKH
jgi:hypothetical protein